MTDEEKKRIIRDNIDAFNRKDEQAFVAALASNAKLVDVPTGEVKVGKEGGKENYRRWATAFPDGKVTVENILVSGDTAVVQFIGEGTQRGPLGPFPATNKRARTRFVDVIKFDTQGKIVEDNEYYDQLSLLQQLGLVPQPAPAGSR